MFGPGVRDLLSAALFIEAEERVSGPGVTDRLWNKVLYEVSLLGAALFTRAFADGDLAMIFDLRGVGGRPASLVPSAVVSVEFC